MRIRAWRAGAAALLLAVVAASAAACGIPRDPDGSLERITGGDLRVGASPADGLVAVDAGTVSGPLVDLVEGFADSRDADVVWTVTSEERLVDGLETGAVDLAIGGMTDATPWIDRVSATRGYSGIGGETAPVVILLPLGENGLQAALEEYLDREVRP